MSRTVAALLVFVAASACSPVTPSARTSPTISSTGTPPAANTGQIAGNLSYPAGVLPAQTVYAVATDGSRFFTVETVFGQRTFTMLGVAPGDYYVLSIAPGFAADPAGYTGWVACGATTFCTDHTLISVQVSAGSTATGVDPGDWFCQDCSFPTIPPSSAPPVRPGVPNYPPNKPLPSFQDRDTAAAQIVSAETSGRVVASSAACPVNVACVWKTGEHDGRSADYLTFQAGSNGMTQTCVIYLVNDSSGWRGLGSAVSTSTGCSLSGAPFPSVGEVGHIDMGLGETGCVRLHSSPSLAAKVVGCLAKGTAVRIDDGPVYVPAKPPLPQIDFPWALDYWWHVAGRGWVVHAYLLARHYG